MATAQPPIVTQASHHPFHHHLQQAFDKIENIHKPKHLEGLHILRNAYVGPFAHRLSRQ